jgi:HEAT repeat protein
MNGFQNPHYWIRWNAVKITETTGKKIDMVSIYLLDLNSTASMRTRIRAAEKLGEIGDKRAVPLLQEIGARGIRDPFVSAAARDVLSRYFNESAEIQIDYSFSRSFLLQYFRKDITDAVNIVLIIFLSLQYFYQRGKISAFKRM